MDDFSPQNASPAINEIEVEQRAQRRQIRSDAELLGDLMRHKGWPRYMSLIEAVGQNYHVKIMQPIENVMEATKCEFAKGVLSGLSLATAMPSLKIKEAQELTRVNADNEE
jgi:hypothetical protein